MCLCCLKSIIIKQSFSEISFGRQSIYGKKILILLLILTFSILLTDMSENKLPKRTIIIGLLSVCLLLLAGTAFWGYRFVFAPNFELSKTVYVFVDREKDFSDLCRQLQDSAGCMRPGSFKLLAGMLKYPENMRTGRYAVHPGMSNLKLLNDLRRGHQAATKLTFNNIRFKKDLAERLSEQLMLKEDEILALLDDSAYCASLGFTTETINALFIPNTYEVYWNIPADKLMQRMKREYNAFWTPARLDKAKAIGLTPVEVATLASIVEEETAAPDEYPIVAGLYLNRLHRGIPLQADPTVKFAIGDFSLQRILFEHLEIDSPYNTYKYAGLPPGPLRIPTIKGLDAVLNYMQHNYLYMCAKEDFSGRHNFAATLAEHNRNANRYRAELNRRGIR